MAREYARVKLAIWADADFRRLSDTAQALYFRLITSPTMSLCGVADWRPKRLAALTEGMTVRGVEKAASELTGTGYIVIDDETEEVLVRSFIRHDGLIKTPNIASAMVKDYAATASPELQSFIVWELLRLKEDQPEMSGWAVADTLLSNPSRNPSPMASPKPSVNPSVNPSHIPQPSSRNLQPASLILCGSDADAWEPNDKHIDAAAKQGIDVTDQAERFRDYIAANGKKYKDLDRAFNNWIKNAKQFGGRQTKQQEVDGVYQRAMARARGEQQ